MPASADVLLEPLRQPVVDSDDQHVGDLRAPVGVDPLLELPDSVRVAHRRQHLALDGRLAHDVTQRRVVPLVAVGGVPPLVRCLDCRTRSAPVLELLGTPPPVLVVVELRTRVALSEI